LVIFLDDLTPRSAAKKAVSMKNLLLPFCFILLISISSKAQNPRLDSLKTRVEQPIADIERVDILNTLAIDLRRNDPDQGLVYAQQALELALKIEYKKGVRDAYNSKGSVLFGKGDYYQSLDLFQKSLALSMEMDELSKIAHAYYAMGVIYRKLGKYPESLELELKALKINEDLADTLEMGNSYSNIGIVYTNMAKYSEALKNLFKAVQLQNSIDDVYGLASSQIGIGNVYFYQNDLEKALEAYTEAMKIGEELEDLRLISLCLDNIAGIYASKEDYASALKNYQASLELDLRTSNKGGMARSYNWIGAIYFKQNDFKKAQEYLSKSLEIATELHDLEQLQQIHTVWTSLDSAQGNFDGALAHYRTSVGFRDSLVNRENSEKILQQQMQFDFDKQKALAEKEQEKKDAVLNEELAKQKLIRNGSMGAALILLLFAIVFFRQRKKIQYGKERSDELLLNILPEEVAEELKQKGSADAKLMEHVTVLFTDFEGFTAMSEQLSPKDLVADIHVCFSAFDAIMEKYGIEKIKTIGDAYMAAGGLPTSNSTHAIDVLNAALEIRDFIADGKLKKIQNNLPYFEIRIGVHTGPVVAGIVGVKKFQYDIWGDTVNIASRMESSGEAGHVNISEETYKLVKEMDGYSFESRGKIDVKGKGKLPMWFVNKSS